MCLVETTAFMTLNVRIFPFVVFILTSCIYQFVDAIWSIQAMDRLKQQKAAQLYSPGDLANKFMYKLAVFYGNRQERRQNRVCEKLKCEFIYTGCLVSEGDPPPLFSCYNIWAEMSLPEAGECLYKPCEDYNQKSTCVLNTDACIQGEGQLVNFGLCKDNNKCCQFPELTELTPPNGTKKKSDPLPSM